jgi:uncharacterized protein YbcC (UPF0753/DUF2309 family)
MTLLKLEKAVEIAEALATTSSHMSYYLSDDIAQQFNDELASLKSDLDKIKFLLHSEKSKQDTKETDLKKKMKKYDIKQNEIARKANVSAAAISLVVSGKSKSKRIIALIQEEIDKKES